MISKNYLIYHKYDIIFFNIALERAEYIFCVFCAYSFGKKWAVIRELLPISREVFQKKKKYAANFICHTLFVKFKKYMLSEWKTRLILTQNEFRIRRKNDTRMGTPD